MRNLGSDMALAMTADMLWTAIKLAAPLIGVTTAVGLWPGFCRPSPKSRSPRSLSFPSSSIHIALELPSAAPPSGLLPNRDSDPTLAFLFRESAF
jgi:hypothetical protein